MVTKLPRMERCACSQLATIRTRVRSGRGPDCIFHCSDTCRNRWLRQKHIDMRSIVVTTFVKDGFKAEATT